MEQQTNLDKYKKVTDELLSSVTTALRAVCYCTPAMQALGRNNPKYSHACSQNFEYMEDYYDEMVELAEFFESLSNRVKTAVTMVEMGLDASNANAMMNVQLTNLMIHDIMACYNTIFSAFDVLNSEEDEFDFVSKTNKIVKKLAEQQKQVEEDCAAYISEAQKEQFSKDLNLPFEKFNQQFPAAIKK